MERMFLFLRWAKYLIGAVYRITVCTVLDSSIYAQVKKSGDSTDSFVMAS